MQDEWKNDVVGIGRALARGELSEREIAILKTDSSWSFIEDLARFIGDVGADLSMQELCDKVTLEIPASTERRFWQQFNRIPNFLKHADADVEMLQLTYDRNERQ